MSKPAIVTQPRRFMIDCGTLSLLPNAALLQVGVVEMDFDHNKIVGEAFWRINVADSIKHGAVADADTFRWWANMDASVLKNAFNRADPNDKTAHWFFLSVFQTQFLHFIGSNLTGENIPDIELWSLGNMDQVWLEHMFRSTGAVAYPWHYWQWNEMRTLRTTFPQVVAPTIKDRQEHHALSDAKAQALHLMKIMQYIRSNIKPVIEDDEL